MADARERVRSRIVRHAEVPVADLTPHPLNPRVHPDGQMKAVDQSLDTLGWVKSVLVNERTGRVVDGHARLKLAVERGEETVPVEFLDLDEAEERAAIAVLDPLAALASTDADALAALVDGGDGKDLRDLIAEDAEDLRALLNLAEAGDPEPPDDFPEFDHAIATEFRCPKCSYEWSGSQK